MADDRIPKLTARVEALEKALDAMAPGWRDADDLVTLVQAGHDRNQAKRPSDRVRTPWRHG